MPALDVKSCVSAKILDRIPIPDNTTFLWVVCKPNIDLLYETPPGVVAMYVSPLGVVFE